MRLLLNCFIIVISLLFFTKYSFCQVTYAGEETEELKFDRLTTREGLSQATVSNILQDSQGYMWFATRDGLNKYDGYTFTVYKSDPTNLNSLSASHTRVLAEDADHNLWIGTNGGLNKFDPKTGLFSSYQHHPKNPNTLSDNGVSAISIDPSGMLWIGTGDGLNRFDPARGEFTRFYHHPTSQNSLGHNDIYDLQMDTSGNLWIGTEKGLDLYDPHTNTFSHILPVAPNNLPDSTYKIIEVYIDRSGTVWAGVDGKGLLAYDPRTNKQTWYVHDPADPSSISSNTIMAVYEDSRGELWMGAWPGGLNRFNRTTGTFTTYRHVKNNSYSLSDNYIKTIYEDRSGMLWIGTFSRGLSMYDRLRNKFRLFTQRGVNSSLVQGQIHALLEDASGNVWVGSEGLIERMDKKTGYTTQFDLTPVSGKAGEKISVYTLYQDRAGTIWVGTRGNGLGKFIPGKNYFQWFTHNPKNQHSLSHNTVTIIQEDQDGKLWMSTNNGLNHFDPVTQNFTRYMPDSTYADKRGHFGISAIHMGKSGLIWVGSARNGIASFNPQTSAFTHYPYKTNQAIVLHNPGTFCIYEDSKGFVWIGFKESVLHRFDPRNGLFTPVTPKEGLPTNQVRGILEDDHGNMWLSTRSDGLYKYDPHTKISRHYDMDNGLQSNEFLGAFYKSKSGEMYFGGKDGFNIFHPGSITDNPFAPGVRISNFSVFNSPRSYTDSIITLSYDENFFSFEYVGLSYSLPDENIYQYRLEGVDEGWIDAGNRRFVSYTNLDPGEYVFRVKAANYDGIWNQQGTSVKLRIIPPLWLQQWFQVTLLLIGCLLGYVWYKSRVYTINARNHHLEQLVALRTEELRQRSLQLEQSLIETRKLQLEAEFQRKRAEEANRLKTELTNLTVHDLKNPLGGIMLYTDLIKESVSDPERVIRLTQTVKDISRQMFHLLSNLLKRAKLESGYTSLQKDKIDIALLARSVVERNQVQARQKGQYVHFKETTGYEVEIDVDLMNDTLENLLSNAIKFTPAGKNIWVSIEATQAHVSISIQDEGLGIQPEEINQLFAPFQRLSARPTGNESSSGLGLYIVKRIIELHQAEIRVESAGINKGSTFTIRLPLIIEEAVMDINQISK